VGYAVGLELAQEKRKDLAMLWEDGEDGDGWTAVNFAGEMELGDGGGKIKKNDDDETSLNRWPGSLTRPREDTRTRAGQLGAREGRGSSPTARRCPCRSVPSSDLPVTVAPSIFQIQLFLLKYS
jgi:hypothetical protein